MDLGMQSSPNHTTSIPARIFSAPSLAALTVFAIYLLSLPPKWATLHISGFLLLLTLLLARRDTWQAPAMRTYLLITCAWLVPVILAGLWQHMAGLETATAWTSLLKLVLRMLGIGLGILLLLQRGWLTLRSATVAVLCVLAANALAGFGEWLFYTDHSLTGWRDYRMAGLAENPNPFGTFMALTAIASAGLLRSQRRYALLWLLLLLAVAAVWASGSRGALLTCAAGLLVLYPPANRTNIIGLLLAIGAFAALYFMTDMHITSLGSDQQRMEVARFAIEKVLEAPLSGWGMDSFTSLPGRPALAAPHNMLLDLAVTSGVIALFGWFGSTSKLMLDLARSRSWNTRVSLAVLMAATVAGILEYSLLNSLHYQGIWMLATAFACWTLATARHSDAMPDTFLATERPESR
jgi:hypothetical protein